MNQRKPKPDETVVFGARLAEQLLSRGHIISYVKLNLDSSLSAFSFLSNQRLQNDISIITTGFIEANLSAEVEKYAEVIAAMRLQYFLMYGFWPTEQDKIY